MAALDRSAVAAVDSSGQVEDVTGMGDQLRDALWRVDSAAPPAVEAPGGLVVAGMGGSAIGGRLALAALGERLRRPLVIADAYALPPWVSEGTLVLCSSYSGNTEETLSCYDEAAERGLPLLAATTGGALAERARRDGVAVIPLPGGFQPRAAVAYGLVATLEAAATLADRLAAEWGPDGRDDGAAKGIARRLDGTVPVIAGAELTAPAAYRWKCQLNENAEVPAFSGALPEIDHNEVVGWDSADEFGRFAAVFLEDAESHPRNRLRTELTIDLVAPGADLIERVVAQGASRLERLVSLVLLGDLVSIYLAVLRGVDPTPVTSLVELKAQMAER